MKANKALISAGGISRSDGVTDYDLNEASMSRLLMNRSEELIVLADHSKLGATTFAHICELKDISTLITDSKCPRDIQNNLLNQGVKVLFPKNTVTH
ncbi:DeoR/GlpR transcriptional regulator [Sporolactobacillus sp. THM7-7]|nr:DeoR/GlpR transcriptional regulator [Sporolactobacillus sp. THM7-7]